MLLQRRICEITQIEGRIAATRTAIEWLEYEIERRYIWASVSECIGEVATLQVGTVVREGDGLGAIVPPGTLKVMSDFPPPAALGWLQTGQPAQLRLEGFPWKQSGAISATVTSVASKVRDGGVGVELAVRPDVTPPIPLQHGLPWTIKIAVDHVSPAMLVLRTAGPLLTVPGTPRSFRGGCGADR